MPWPEIRTLAADSRFAAVGNLERRQPRATASARLAFGIDPERHHFAVPAGDLPHDRCLWFTSRAERGSLHRNSDHDCTIDSYSKHKPKYTDTAHRVCHLTL
jgi:hypothetical protein